MVNKRDSGEDSGKCRDGGECFRNEASSAQDTVVNKRESDEDSGKCAIGRRGCSRSGAGGTRHGSEQTREL